VVPAHSERFGMSRPLSAWATKACSTACAIRRPVRVFRENRGEKEFREEAAGGIAGFVRAPAVGVALHALSEPRLAILPLVDRGEEHDAEQSNGIGGILHAVHKFGLAGEGAQYVARLVMRQVDGRAVQFRTERADEFGERAVVILPANHGRRFQACHAAHSGLVNRFFLLRRFVYDHGGRKRCGSGPWRIFSCFRFRFPVRLWCGLLRRGFLSRGLLRASLFAHPCTDEYTGKAEKAAKSHERPIAEILPATETTQPRRNHRRVLQSIDSDPLAHARGYNPVP
jgi:hypothetical protein